MEEGEAIAMETEEELTIEEEEEIEIIDEQIAAEEEEEQEAREIAAVQELKDLAAVMEISREQGLTTIIPGEGGRETQVITSGPTGEQVTTIPVLTPGQDVSGLRIGDPIPQMRGLLSPTILASKQVRMARNIKATLNLGPQKLMDHVIFALPLVGKRRQMRVRRATTKLKWLISEGNTTNFDVQTSLHVHLLYLPPPLQQAPVNLDGQTTFPWLYLKGLTLFDQTTFIPVNDYGHGFKLEENVRTYGPRRGFRLGRNRVLMLKAVARPYNGAAGAFLGGNGGVGSVTLIANITLS